MRSIFVVVLTGFGLLESGCVHKRNETNIMMKNVVDVIFGGLTYWIFGFGLQFSMHDYTNPFVGVGDFFLITDEEEMGIHYATFIFQVNPLLVFSIFRFFLLKNQETEKKFN